MNRRLLYTFLLPLIVAAGLLSRQFPSVPAETGDALWAWMIFGLVVWLVPSRPTTFVAGISLLICYLVEFSQLYRADWIDQLRRSLPGRLILGQGFLWQDLVAYAVGVAAAVAADRLLPEGLLPKKKDLPSGKS